MELSRKEIEEKEARLVEKEKTLLKREATLSDKVKTVEEQKRTIKEKEAELSKLESSSKTPSPTKNTAKLELELNRLREECANQQKQNRLDAQDYLQQIE